MGWVDGAGTHMGGLQLFVPHGPSTICMVSTQRAWRGLGLRMEATHIMHGGVSKMEIGRAGGSIGPGFGSTSPHEAKVPLPEDAVGTALRSTQEWRCEVAVRRDDSHLIYPLHMSHRSHTDRMEFRMEKRAQDRRDKVCAAQREAFRRNS